MNFRKSILLSATIMGAVATSAQALQDSNSSDETSLVRVSGVGQLDGLVDQARLAELDLPQAIEALNNGTITSESLVLSYLDRIARHNNTGHRLNAVITVNPDAVAFARALDQERRSGNIRGAMHGVPVLLKDNIESDDNMPTTAGSSALRDNFTGRDSPLAAKLAENGAIILGKANLSQWANFRSTDSNSGWSALGGQVKNPHILDRNPCGSSSGSGVAVAASFVPAAVGTETNGSIICPSNAAGIVGFKPSVGVISQQYIIPISASQDTAGPMNKTVRGAAIMMNAMTDRSDFTDHLSPDQLQGVRVGVLRYAEGGNQRIKAVFDAALSDLEAAGAVLVEITERPERPEGYGQKAYDLLKYEFKAGLNDYLAGLDTDTGIKTLDDLIAFNDQSDVEQTLFGQDIFTASNAMGSLSDQAYLDAKQLVQTATRAGGIDALMEQYDVKLLVAPSGPIVPRRDSINGDVWPEFPGAGSMAARAGYPHITVPMGGYRYLPLGLSFIAGGGDDAEVLGWAYAYEQLSQRRLDPQYFPSATAIPEIAAAVELGD